MNSRKTTFPKSPFYDVKRVRQIPIEDVCRRMLGLPIEKRSGKIWCKARAEKDASTILHPENNTFYDFGSLEHGDVIHFVAYVQGISWKEALNRLAEEYHIPAENSHRTGNSTDLSLWEYEEIGIYGDLATKNFEYGVHLSTQRMQELFEKYAMPVSQLRQEHPKTYERILRQKAIPHLMSLRNQYYLDVWQKHLLVQDLGCPELFSSKDIQEELKERCEELERAERLMSRAVKGTRIRWKMRTGYDPQKDLTGLIAGRICPNLGPLTRNGLRFRSKRKDSQILFRSVDYLWYALSGLENHPHYAYFRSGQVIVGYLEEDRAIMGLILNQRNGGDASETKPSLGDQVSAAAVRQGHSDIHSKAIYSEPEH